MGRQPTTPTLSGSTDTATRIAGSSRAKRAHRPHAGNRHYPTGTIERPPLTASRGFVESISTDRQNPGVCVGSFRKRRHGAHSCSRGSHHEAMDAYPTTAAVVQSPLLLRTEFPFPRPIVGTNVKATCDGSPSAAVVFRACPPCTEKDHDDQ